MRIDFDRIATVALLRGANKVRSLMPGGLTEDGLPAMETEDVPHLSLLERNRAIVNCALFKLERSQIFLVDREDSRMAMNSAFDSDEQLCDYELPPLPFEMIALEPSDGAGWVFGHKDENGEVVPDEAAVSFMMLEEIEQGESWVLESLMHRPGDAGGLNTLSWVRSVLNRGHGLVHEDNLGDDHEFYRRSANSVIQLIHLITANGTKQEAISPPRPQRRNWERKSGRKFPVVRLVVIGGENNPSEINTETGRVYTHRWLVRGHWRNYQDGKRIWVRPYVKGPAGAPWITQIRVKPAA